jgi:hypothetical protein
MWLQVQLTPSHGRRVSEHQQWARACDGTHDPGQVGKGIGAEQCVAQADAASCRRAGTCRHATTDGQEVHLGWGSLDGCIRRAHGDTVRRFIVRWRADMRLPDLSVV